MKKKNYVYAKRICDALIEKKEVDDIVRDIIIDNSVSDVDVVEIGDVVNLLIIRHFGRKNILLSFRFRKLMFVTIMNISMLIYMMTVGYIFDSIEITYVCATASILIGLMVALVSSKW